jgi:hypothetical protein
MEEPHRVKLLDHFDQDKWATLEERLRDVEGFDFYDSVRAAEICLVPNVVMPKKFRVPEFIKYMGLECLNTNLRSYYNKMVEIIHDKKLLIHFFPKQLDWFCVKLVHDYG